MGFLQHSPSTPVHVDGWTGTTGTDYDYLTEYLLKTFLHENKQSKRN
jgi:hypothetical protein